jgi:hypothetical protein
MTPFCRCRGALGVDGGSDARRRLGSQTLVFIGREYGGQFLAEGTSFITATLVSTDQGWQTIVTAKHVIEPFLNFLAQN